METHSLSGRVAVVTGASRGLGKQMAMALADEGAATSRWQTGAVARKPSADEALLLEKPALLHFDRSTVRV